MKRRAPFDSERALARALVQWLRQEGWTVYQEVHDGSATCDVVATRDKLTWAIETKLRFGVEVLEQARRWRWRANLVSVATPPARHSGVLYDVCGWLGIGWLSVLAGTPYMAPMLTEELHPDFMRIREDRDSLAKRLRPEQLDGVEAGGNGGGFHTPFKGTCRQVAELLASHPEGMSLRDLIAAMGKGHYRTSAAARAGIAHWAKQGVIKGVEMRREGKSLRLYPLPPDADARVVARKNRIAREAG